MRATYNETQPPLDIPESEIVVQDVCLVDADHRGLSSAPVTERLYSPRCFMVYVERDSNNITFAGLTSWRKNTYLFSWPLGGVEENNILCFLKVRVSTLEIPRRHKTMVPNRHRKSRREWGWTRWGWFDAYSPDQNQGRGYMLLWPWSVFKR